jgi:23S rRNA pseudouridine2457 synthase
MRRLRINLVAAFTQGWHLAKLVLFNKPYGVLCQFTDRPVPMGNGAELEHAPRPTLADYIPLRDVYAAGRLDFDSEGLVVLTDDGAVQARIANPRHKMRKRYVVQVSGVADDGVCARLRAGVMLRDGPARALSATACSAIDWPRDPAVRHPHPTSWVALEIDEGRNRQVRRMLAAVGHPVLRLVRTHVGPWSLDGIAPGTFTLTSVHAPAPAQGRRGEPRVPRSGPASSPQQRDDRRRSTRSTPPNRPRGAPSSRTRRPS